MGKRLIPFDLEKAAAGAKVVFKNYPEATVKQTILMHGPIRDYLLVIHTGKDGFEYHQSVYEDTDKFLIEEETKEYWYAVFKNNYNSPTNPIFIGTTSFESEEAVKSYYKYDASFIKATCVEF